MKQHPLIQAADLHQAGSLSKPGVTVFTGRAPQSAACAEDCWQLYPLRKLGFRLRPEFNNDGHRHVWVQPETLAVFTYVEHVLFLEVPMNIHAGADNIRRLEAFYDRH